MASQTEKRLQQLSKRSGVLVPLIEDYHRAFGRHHWDSDDIEWLHYLMERISRRENERNTEAVYSPSGLGGCLRQSFFAKNFKELGIPRKFLKKVETHFYFENGTWVHLKLQVMIYKLSKMGLLTLHGTEIPVQGKHKDNKGTLDVCFERDRVYGVDIKGWNTHWFMMLAKGDTPASAEIQLANYIMMANSGKNDLPRIDAGLILAENKAGPVQGFPAAVAEAEIPLRPVMSIVRDRLAELRRHEEEGSYPKAECTSTKDRDFKECPFRATCKEEVERAERQAARKSPRRNSAKFKVAVPAPRRSDRSRRNRN